MKIFENKNILLLFSVSLFMIISQFAHINSFTGDEIKSFFDREIKSAMDEYKIAGVTLSVVQDKDILYSNGYGYSDLDSNIKVNSEQTLFRAGSISKLFVWTAVMQLEEQGKINLDEDINKYLKNVQIKNKFDKPITMKHLMSHTPGFEDIIIGLFLKDEKKLVSLEEYISRQPKRIIPPGQEIAYSNYGTALAGYIVECVSGMSFDEYIEKNIFQPLNMKYATFRQPVPAELQKYLSNSYSVNKKGFENKFFEIVQAAPAGAVSISSDDISKFMIAHLNNGSYQESQILKTDTVNRMNQPHFRKVPGQNGFAHGFIEMNMNGEKIIGHGGDTVFAHSILALFPERKLGLFISTNTATGQKLTLQVYTKFLDHFFPVKLKSIKNTKNDTNYLKKYTGSYSVNRRSESDFTKLMSVMMTVDVKLSKDKKSLEILDIFKFKFVKVVEINKNVFRSIDSDMKYVFIEDENGKITSLMYDFIPVFQFNRTPFVEKQVFNLAIIIFFLLIFLSGLFVPPVGILGYVIKKIRKKGIELYTGLSGTILVSVYLLMSLFTVYMSFNDFIFTIPPLIFPVLYYLIFLTSLAVVFSSVLSWIKKLWKLPQRIYFTIFAAGSACFVWFLIYWKFIF